MTLRHVEGRPSISASDMRPGQIAEVVRWAGTEDYMGHILMRGAGNKWFNLTNGSIWTPDSIGNRSLGQDGLAWSNLFVIVLPPGETLVVE